MDDYRAVKALGFENIKEVDDKLHWADILATKVAQPKFLTSLKSLRLRKLLD